MTATVPKILVLLMPRDSVRLIAFHDYGWIVVHNAGDRDIFVSHFYFESREPQPRHRTKAIYKTVAPGDFLVMKGKTDFKPGTWVTTHTREEWIKKLQTVDKSECLEMAFFWSDDPSYKMISAHHKEMGLTFFVLDYDGRLYYEVAGSSERGVVEFNAVAAIRSLETPECR